MGRSVGDAAPFLELDGHADGAISTDGQVAGTYLHGLFANAELRQHMLAGLRHEAVSTSDAADAREREFDRLASVVRAHVDVEAVRLLLWPQPVVDTSE